MDILIVDIMNKPAVNTQKCLCAGNILFLGKITNCGNFGVFR